MNWKTYTENLRTDTELSRQSLETTRMFAGCWLAAIERWPNQRHPGIELQVEEAARFDWGDGTKVLFEPERARVIIYDDRRIIAIDEIPAEIKAAVTPKETA